MASIVVVLAIVLALVLTFLIATVSVAVLYIRSYVFGRVSDPSKYTIGFFHPYCNAGGGGERVLWCAIAALGAVQDHSNLRILIYTGDVDVPAARILSNARTNFGIVIPESLDVQFVPITSRHLLEASRYPRFTMLGQNLGSMAVAWECLLACTPDVWIDTTGAAFTFLLAKLLARCLTACYVHYPTITTDMMERVHDRRPTYNNDERVSGSVMATRVKLWYYHAFASMYRWMGGLTDAVMVNSSWTCGHITSLWALPPPHSRLRLSSLLGRTQSGYSSEDALLYLRPTTDFWPSVHRALLGGPDARPMPRIVFPPCNTDMLKALPLGGRERLVVSVGQFRPEKDHALQLRAFALFRARSEAFQDVQLHLIGGCRDAGDRGRVEALQALAAELGVADAVKFRVNVPLPELKAALGVATAGLHSMWNEHFGISVVEMMASGTITIAHNSGGPRADIVDVTNDDMRTGFLAATPEEYADALESIFGGEVDTVAIAERARLSSDRFSDASFSDGFFAATIGLITLAKHEWTKRNGGQTLSPRRRKAD